MKRWLALVLCLTFPHQYACAQPPGENDPPQEAVPVLKAQLGHSSNMISFVAFSPDGKQVLTGDGTNLHLWDTASGNELRIFRHNNSARFSPDGKHILTADIYDMGCLWETASGLKIRTFPKVVQAVFSPDGKWLLTATDRGKTASLREAASGNIIRDYHGSDEVTELAFSADGKRVAAAGSKGTVTLWDTDNGKIIRTFRTRNRNGFVTFSPDGQWILAAGRVWETASGKAVRSFPEAAFPGPVAFSADGKHLLAVCNNEVARLWEVSSGKEGQSFKGHEGQMTAAAFSPDGKYVLTGGGDFTARLWDRSDGKQVRIFRGNIKRVTAAAFSPDNKQILTGSDSPAAYLWDAVSGKQIRTLQDREDWAMSVSFSPSGKQILTSGLWAAFQVHRWDAASGVKIGSFDGDVGLFSRDGEKILSINKNSGARLWKVDSGATICDVKGGDLLFCIAISRDGKQVLTGSRDGAVCLWDASDGKKIRSFEGADRMIFSVDFSADGKQAAASSYSVVAGTKWTYLAWVWDVATGKTIRSFRGHTDIVRSVCFSSDGAKLLTASDDGTARLWDIAGGKEVLVLNGHFGAVITAVFSSDGKRILTGSLDGTARLWDAGSGKELCRLISFLDGTWAVIDAAGRYDAANDGVVDGLHFIVRNQQVPLNEVKDRFYDRGLLGKHMGFNRLPLRGLSDEKGPIRTMPSPKDAKQFRLEVPPQPKIGKIFIVGNEFTMDSVIVQALGLYPGQPLRYPELKIAEANLMRLRIFDDTPDRRPTITVLLSKDGDPSVADLLVRVNETTTRSFFVIPATSPRGLVLQGVLDEWNFDPFGVPSSIAEILEGRAFRGGGIRIRLVLFELPLMQRPESTIVSRFANCSAILTNFLQQEEMWTLHLYSLIDRINPTN